MPRRGSEPFRCADIERGVYPFAFPPPGRREHSRPALVGVLTFRPSEPARSFPTDLSSLPTAPLGATPPASLPAFCGRRVHSRPSPPPACVALEPCGPSKMQSYGSCPSPTSGRLAGEGAKSPRGARARTARPLTIPPGSRHHPAPHHPRCSHLTRQAPSRCGALARAAPAVWTALVSSLPDQLPPILEF